MKKVALLLCLAFAPLAHAQEDRGMYFGAGLGSFDYDEGSGGVSDSTYAYHLFGGYKVSNHFALEFELGGTGDLEESFTETIPGVGTITLDVDGTYNIYKLTAFGILPFDSFSLFAGAGYFSAALEGEVNAPGFGTVGSLDGHERGATASFGIQHNFGLDLRSFGLRGQYDWYDFPEGIDASGITIAVLFRF